jgi:hypothetical protein
MVNPVQPVGKRSIEPTRIEPAADRASLASNAASGPAAPPPLSAPATVVQLSDAVFARQRGVVPGRARNDERAAERRLSSEQSARAVAEGASLAVRSDAVLAVAAQGNLPVERVLALLFD